MTLKGHVHYNAETDVFDLVFWVEENSEVALTNLGTLNYQLYDRNGNALSGTGSAGSIIPGLTGLYALTEISGPTFLTNNESFLIYVETTLNASPISTYLPFSLTNI